MDYVYFDAYCQECDFMIPCQPTAYVPDHLHPTQKALSDQAKAHSEDKLHSVVCCYSCNRSEATFEFINGRIFRPGWITAFNRLRLWVKRTARSIDPDA